MERDRVAYSLNEVATQLGVSRDSVVRAISKGKIKVIRFGRRVLVPRAELERLLEAR